MSWWSELDESKEKKRKEKQRKISSGYDKTCVRSNYDGDDKDEDDGGGGVRKKDINYINPSIFTRWEEISLQFNAYLVCSVAICAVWSISNIYIYTWNWSLQLSLVLDLLMSCAMHCLYCLLLHLLLLLFLVRNAIMYFPFHSILCYRCITSSFFTASTLFCLFFSKTFYLLCCCCLIVLFSFHLFSSLLIFLASSNDALKTKRKGMLTTEKKCVEKS